MTTISDPILVRFRKALDDVYGARIERVVLFGSRARGDGGPDSDYDVALFLNDLEDAWAEVDRLVDIEERLRVETGADIHTIPFPAGRWRDRVPLMHDIRKDGLDL